MESIQFVISFLIIPVIAGIIASLIAILFQNKYRLYTQFNQLCNEVRVNHNKLSDTTIQANIAEMMRSHQESLLDTSRREWIGFHPKEISEWIIVNDPDSAFADEYRYLSSNKFRYFVLNGYLSKIPDHICHDLIRFYFLCERFSVVTQNYESKMFMNIERINLEPLNKQDSEFEANFIFCIKNIESVVSKLKPDIDHLYNHLNGYFIEMTRIEFLFKRFSAKFTRRDGF